MQPTLKATIVVLTAYIHSQQAHSMAPLKLQGARAVQIRRVSINHMREGTSPLKPSALLPIYIGGKQDGYVNHKRKPAAGQA